MSDHNAPDAIDQLAEAQRLDRKESERLRFQVEALTIKLADLERRIVQGWRKQGETNTRLTHGLETHKHQSGDWETGGPLFRVESDA